MTSYSRTIGAITAAATLLLVACENLPGTRTQQATGAGTAAGAVIGAAAMENQLLGALLGGAAGAAGGYLIGARTDWFEDREDGSTAAREAVEQARENPATAADVRDAATADLNDDGFVTMDELVAMEEAGLGDDEIIDRLEATDQVFELTRDQQARLVEAGLSPRLVAEVGEVNREARDELLGDPEVISRRRS